MQDRPRILRRSPSAPLLLTAWLVVGLLQTAAGQDEVALTMRIEAPGEPAMQMKFSVGEGSLRMDLPQATSMIWTNGSMLMIQHEQKSYMEWGPEQMRVMPQMMQRMQQQGDSGQGQPSLDLSQVRFRETGRRENIGDWDAFEVEMTGLPECQAGALWMTRDVGTGMLELLARVGGSLNAMPMFVGGAGPGQEMTRYRDLTAASGMPQGQVVRIVSSDKGQTTAMTLVSVEPGPLPTGIFSAPASYTKMQMPTMPGRQ